MQSFLFSACVFALAFGAVSCAQVSDKQAEVYLTERVLIPGDELPAGTYVFKVLDAVNNRHVVQIFNADETKLQATVLAFPNYRLQPKGGQPILLWAAPEGSPPALRSWFVPGDNYGLEFAYPKAMAERIVRDNNNAIVARYEESNGLKADQIADLRVENEPGQTPSNTVTAQTPPPQPLETDQNDSATLPGELPRTASPMPGVLLMGLASFTGALVMRRRYA